MNCEQVEELLGAYLDNALAPEDRRNILAHLQHCAQCNATLADFRRFDALLSQLPRVSPDPALRDRIFFSPEYLELTGTFDRSGITREDQTLPKIPARSPRQNTPGRPHLFAIPGGRSTTPTSAVRSSTRKLTKISLPVQKRRSTKGLRVLLATVAAAVFIALGVAGLLNLVSWRQHPQIAGNGAITPPTGPQQSGPLSTGMRFVFLRDGTLWSVLANDGSQGQRLTPDSVTVSSNWVVSPPLAGRSAGDRLAYIDLQQGFVHTIRSDGQQDIVIKQPLLKAGVSPASIWDTGTGMTILNSLAWSKDGHMLAFVADPMGNGQTNLYIYSADTGKIQVVPLSSKGSVSHPVWSPDGVRLAFEFIQNGAVSILDYNVQNHGLLNLTDGANIQSSSSDVVLNLDWSPDLDTPAVTWSLGVLGHVHSIWEHPVGANGTGGPVLLTSGDYAQAIYSRSGHGGIGSWLLVDAFAGRPTDLQHIDVLPGSGLVTLTSGKQVDLAWWSPNGDSVDYLDSISSGVGTLHVVNLITGIDTLIAKSVANEPTPAWSEDSQQLAYSTGIQSVIVNIPNPHASNKSVLKLHGSASAFLWSATSPRQLVVALTDAQEGIYIVDTQNNTSLQVDQQGISGNVEWTEIP